tara:strand:- start:22043 stop:22585 length:543 start_codon:yes stop_codon:yes gene_type:complete
MKLFLFLVFSCVSVFGQGFSLYMNQGYNRPFNQLNSFQPQYGFNNQWQRPNNNFQWQRPQQYGFQRPQYGFQQQWGRPLNNFNQQWGNNFQQRPNNNSQWRQPQQRPQPLPQTRPAPLPQQSPPFSQQNNNRPSTNNLQRPPPNTSTNNTPMVIRRFHLNNGYLYGVPTPTQPWTRRNLR